jgi:hypothetical protein
MVDSFVTGSDDRTDGECVRSMKGNREGACVKAFDGEIEGDLREETTVFQNERGKVNLMGTKSVRKLVYCLERMMGLHLTYQWEH